MAEHINCVHDPEGADGNPFAAMICSPSGSGPEISSHPDCECPGGPYRKFVDPAGGCPLHAGHSPGAANVLPDITCTIPGHCDGDNAPNSSDYPGGPKSANQRGEIDGIRREGSEAGRADCAAPEAGEDGRGVDREGDRGSAPREEEEVAPAIPESGDTGSSSSEVGRG